jgi:hypothetical protein
MRRPPMKCTPGRRQAACLVCVLMAVGASRVEALELVPGGYGVAPRAEVDSAAPSGGDHVALGEAVDSSALAMDFTPRDGAGVWSRPEGASDGSPLLRFDLNINGTPGAAFTPDGFGASHDDLRADRSGTAALTVGGAMHWSDWTVGGGLGRAQIMGSDIDLMSASLGYGRLTAEIAIGQSQDYTVGQPRDVLMLSTDLAAWSWLTLESNLAVGSAPSAEGDRERNRDSVATGRLGLRLNF